MRRSWATYKSHCSAKGDSVFRNGAQIRKPRHRRACVRGINYIWLSDGEPAPSDRDICRFLSEVLSEYAEEILYRLVGKIHGLGEPPFVNRRGKRKSELQKDIERLNELICRKTKYASYQEAFKGRNSQKATAKCKFQKDL